MRSIKLNIRNQFEKIIRPNIVGHAHCDIPCGIYHPHIAQQGAETVEKMMSLIADLGTNSDPASQASLSRYVTQKEEAAEIVKHEVRIIWGDYFKPPHLEMFPDLHEKVWNAYFEITSNFSEDEKKKLFYKNAEKYYRI